MNATQHQDIAPSRRRPSLSIVRIVIAMLCISLFGCFGGLGCPGERSLLSATFTAIVVPQGQTRTGELVIQNTQQVTGVQTIGFGDHPDLRFTPPTFNIDVTGQTVIRLPFTVTAEAGTPPRATGADIYWGLVRIGSGSIQITGNATPTFLFFANQDTVSVPNNVNSAPVEFTVTSVNGFIGQVDITNQTDGEVQEVPIVDPFNVYVTPTPPAKFTRRFIRFDGTTPLHVTYTATSGTITKTLTITVNHP